MNPARGTLEEDYYGFIANPQKYGVWSMRIELTNKQTSSLASFLNVDSYLLRPRRRYYSQFGSSYHGDAVDERPPVLLPKLFAYLRASIPQKERSALPSLTPDRSPHGPSRGSSRQNRRAYNFLRDFLTPPPNLGLAKRRKLKKALDIYRRHFLACRIVAVPDNVAKVDIACRGPLTYLQVTEEPPVIRILSPREATLQDVKNMLSLAMQDPVDGEITKVFSPESALMEMYLPTLQLIPVSSILKDKTAAGNVRQALEEAIEERFVHSIRATGIAAEELLVEIYETYLRDKAPEQPLGNLVSDLNTRLQEVVQGAKATRENPLGTARKAIGKAIEAEKQGTNNRSFLALAEQLQKNIIPMLDGLKQLIDDSPSNTKAQKINLFPSHVQRCVSELIILRNRVSHRVERAVSVATVGYVDAAIALRDFIVVAKWWESERKEIDYKGSRKAIIQETVKRSKSIESEPEPSSDPSGGA